MISYALDVLCYA